MRVRMRADISGTRNGERWPRRGELVDVPDAEGEHLVSAGLAVKDEGRETATAAEPETPEAKTTKPRRRKSGLTKASTDGDS